jgi:hypothetical protein
MLKNKASLSDRVYVPKNSTTLEVLNKIFKVFQERNAETNNGLNIRFLKYTSKATKLKFILNFLNICWASWDEYKTIPIFMKDKGSDCHNYDGISLPNLIYTICEKIISRCLNRIIEEHNQT